MTDFTNRLFAGFDWHYLAVALMLGLIVLTFRLFFRSGGAKQYKVTQRVKAFVSLVATLSTVGAYGWMEIHVGTTPATTTYWATPNWITLILAGVGLLFTIHIAAQTLVKRTAVLHWTFASFGLVSCGVYFFAFIADLVGPDTFGMSDKLFEAIVDQTTNVSRDAALLCAILSILTGLFALAAKAFNELVDRKVEENYAQPYKAANNYTPYPLMATAETFKAQQARRN